MNNFAKPFIVTAVLSSLIMTIPSVSYLKANVTVPSADRDRALSSM